MLNRSACRIAGIFCLAGYSLLRTSPAAAMEDSVLQALEIADNTVFEEVKSHTLSMAAEIAGTINEAGKNIQRLSLDMRLDTPVFSDKARVVVSNRTDARFYGALGHSGNVNTLREAYISYKAASDTIVETGRINTRYGVALGYNPTDFLGKNTVRSVVSADPESLRTNRLGNVMIRLQQGWDKASVTAIIAPKLGDKPNNAAFSPDWAAGNPRDRLLLSASYKFGENFNPQILYFQESGRSPQFGLNISRVLSRSTLVYAEWAGGRQPLTWQNALPDGQQEDKWRNRTAAGITWSSDSNLTLRLEGHYDGSADNEKASQKLSRLPPAAIAQSGLSGNMQDVMASKRSVLFQAYHKDIIDQYDLNLILQRDLQKSKNIGLAEVRHHMGPADVALQWQKTYSLNEKKGYEITPEQRWQLSLNYYF